VPFGSVQKNHPIWGRQNGKRQTDNQAGELKNAAMNEFSSRCHHYARSLCNSME
jgi:hypothetical protein